MNVRVLLASLLVSTLSFPAFAGSKESSHKKQEDDTCPCFTKKALLSWFDSSDGCYDYTLATAAGPRHGTFLAYYDGQGLEAGVADYYYYDGPFCAAVNLTTFAGPFVVNITPDQYEECAEIVLEVAEKLDMDCSASAP